MDPLTKVELEMEKEQRKQITLNYGAMAIAFSRYWGWGSKKIDTVMERTYRAWDECAATNQRSMVQMLDEETGIELKPRAESKGWRELAYLNAEIDVGKMSKSQWIYMRHRQIEWQGTLIAACILLALHRRYDFGYERCQRLITQMTEIKQEYKWNPEKIRKACKEITSINLVNKFSH